MQLPPRGCVLKPLFGLLRSSSSGAAASARLCVETLVKAGVLVDDSGSCLRAAVC